MAGKTLTASVDPDEDGQVGTFASAGGSVDVEVQAVLGLVRDGKVCDRRFPLERHGAFTRLEANRPVRARVVHSCGVRRGRPRRLEPIGGSVPDPFPPVLAVGRVEVALHARVAEVDHGQRFVRRGALREEATWSSEDGTRSAGGEEEDRRSQHASDSGCGMPKGREQAPGGIQ